MHNARLERSDRLRRVLNLLLLGPHTTWQISREAGVCAVNSIIAELRANGIPVNCRCLRRGVFEYSLPTGQLSIKIGVNNGQDV
jgi:hypothetical protein